MHAIEGIIQTPQKYTTELKMDHQDFLLVLPFPTHPVVQHTRQMQWWLGIGAGCGPAPWERMWTWSLDRMQTYSPWQDTGLIVRAGCGPTPSHWGFCMSALGCDSNLALALPVGEKQLTLHVTAMKDFGAGVLITVWKCLSCLMAVWCLTEECCECEKKIPQPG